MATGKPAEGHKQQHDEERLERAVDLSVVAEVAKRLDQMNHPGRQQVEDSRKVEPPSR